MKLPISIIIPTLNEEKYLKKLLQSIQNQTQKPLEIIVSDGFSNDGTRKVAKAFGCKLINGGSLRVARNNGAKIASGKYLFFLDSDMILPKTFLENTYNEVLQKDLTVATALLVPISNHPVDKFLYAFTNNFAKVVKDIRPHALGGIFIKKSVHDKIKGFDPRLFLGEDHDYTIRASKHGKYSYIKSEKLYGSVRRLLKEGRMKLALKYFIAEMHQSFVGPMRKEIFTYEFGKHNKDYLN